MEFESEVGDLSSILKVDQRRREALKEQYGDMQTLLLIDRYKFLNLVPCTGDQLKLMGYSVCSCKFSMKLARMLVNETFTRKEEGNIMNFCVAFRSLLFLI